MGFQSNELFNYELLFYSLFIIKSPRFGSAEKSQNIKIQISAIEHKIKKTLLIIAYAIDMHIITNNIKEIAIESLPSLNLLQQEK